MNINDKITIATEVYKMVERKLNGEKMKDDIKNDIIDSIGDVIEKSITKSLSDLTRQFDIIHDKLNKLSSENEELRNKLNESEHNSHACSCNKEKDSDTTNSNTTDLYSNREADDFELDGLLMTEPTSEDPLGITVISFKEDPSYHLAYPNMDLILGMINSHETDFYDLKEKIKSLIIDNAVKQVKENKDCYLNVSIDDYENLIAKFIQPPLDEMVLCFETNSDGDLIPFNKCDNCDNYNDVININLPKPNNKPCNLNSIPSIDMDEDFDSQIDKFRSLESFLNSNNINLNTENHPYKDKYGLYYNKDTKVNLDSIIKDDGNTDLILKLLGQPVTELVEQNSSPFTKNNDNNNSMNGEMLDSGHGGIIIRDLNNGITHDLSHGIPDNLPPDLKAFLNYIKRFFDEGE